MKVNLNHCAEGSHRSLTKQRPIFFRIGLSCGGGSPPAAINICGQAGRVMSPTPEEGVEIYDPTPNDGVGTFGPTRPRQWIGENLVTQTKTSKSCEHSARDPIREPSC